MVKLKTLHGERSESTFAIEGVKVTEMHGDSGWLALPKLYSRREIPVDKEEIATPTKIREWKYLEPISNEIVQNDDVHVGLLIGANCMKALEPTRILQSQDGGPYAYKTRLGWCVVGPIVQLKIVPLAVIEWQSKMLLHQNLDHIISLLKIQ